jgi:endonuclease YncB( thermonuclease family)
MADRASIHGASPRLDGLISPRLSSYADSGLAWIDGDTWTVVYEGAGGVRFRMTIVVADGTQTYVWHRSVEGGPWVETSEGSMTKVR